MHVGGNVVEYTCMVHTGSVTCALTSRFTHLQLFSLPLPLLAEGEKQTPSS